MELTFTAKPRRAVCPFQSPPEPGRAARKVTFGQFDQSQLASKPLPPTAADGYTRSRYSPTPAVYTPGGYK